MWRENGAQNQVILSGKTMIFNVNLMYNQGWKWTQATNQQKHNTKDENSRLEGWHGRAKGHGVAVPLCCPHEPSLVNVHGLKCFCVWVQAKPKGSILSQNLSMEMDMNKGYECARWKGESK